MKFYILASSASILLGAVPGVFSSEDEFIQHCSGGGQVEVEYCGGIAPFTPVNQLSCTPFPLKSKELPPYVPGKPDVCENLDLAKYAGPNSYHARKVWYDYEDNNSNYWVFHGCDGAGFMDDCAGGETYVEQFGPLVNNPIFPMILNDCKDGWESHCKQPFWHPGTKSIYEWYNAGQLTYGDGDWPDKVAKKPWFENMNLYAPVYDTPGNAYVIMYPWVCDQNGETDVWSTMWGINEPYGTETSHTKCYYDNEPWDNDHLHSKLIPPVWQAYKFYNDGLGTITGWMVAEKKYDSQFPVNYDKPPFYLNEADPWMMAAVE